MKWHGHKWREGVDNLQRHAAYYAIESADMQRDPYNYEAGFVEEGARDRVIMLWNATRHLEMHELEAFLATAPKYEEA